MAFFDDLGKKISQAGQTAVQKTKDFGEITKINSVISDEEKNIERAYRELGKLYFEHHATDPEEAFAPLVKNIRSSAQKIIDCRNQIKDLRGVVCCEKCGAEIPNNVSFCSACGAPAPKIAVPEQPKCPKCGAIASADTVFCTSCGTKIKN